MSKAARPKAPPLDSAKGEAFGNLDFVPAAPPHGTCRRPEVMPVQGGSPWRVQGRALAFASFGGHP